MQKDKGFWIGLSLINLTVVALFGMLMRSKMIFSMPFPDYRNLLSAHAQFAFCGWTGLALITLLIYDVLPGGVAANKRYQATLWGLQTGAAGTGLGFLFLGYSAVSVFFLCVYLLATYFFGWFYLKDMQQAKQAPLVKWLSLGAIGSLMLAATGPLLISFIVMSRSGHSLFYRDVSYAFLHLQYNGFFTLAIMAVLFTYWQRKGRPLPKAAGPFSLSLLLSVIPTLFTALLWHNRMLFYILAAAGCALLLISSVYFIPLLRQSLRIAVFRSRLSRLLWLAAALSFLLKMVLTTGTLYPPLGNAAYGARPVIIGFLHLVFLGFASFFLLASFLEAGFFSHRKKRLVYPFWIFGIGIISNELFLFLQGLSVLSYTNSPVYNWLLWGGSILLFIGALFLSLTFYQCRRHKKAAAQAAAPIVQ